MEAVAEQAGRGATPRRLSRGCVGSERRATSRYASRVLLDGALLAPAYLGHGEGRMRHGVRGDDSHESSFPQASTGRSNVRTCAPFNGSIVHPANSRSCPLPPHAPIRYASVDGRALAALTDRLERRRSHPWSWSGSGAPCRRCRNASRKTPRWACRAPCPPIARTSSRWTARS